MNVRTEKKIKRKSKGEGTVSIVTEPEEKRYRISFSKRWRLHENSPSRSVINRGGFPRRGSFYSLPIRE